jgi:PPOX class probable F420-dependent enzyme
MPSMLPPDVRRLAEGTNYAHVATLLPDGGPHVVPVWIGVEGERLVFMTDPESRKGRNLARDPRVALSITEQERPNVMAHVRGRVVEMLDGDEGWAIIDRLAQEYLGMPYPLRSGRVAMLVEPDRAWAHSF